MGSSSSTAEEYPEDEVFVPPTEAAWEGWWKFAGYEPAECTDL